MPLTSSAIGVAVSTDIFRSPDRIKSMFFGTSLAEVISRLVDCSKSAAILPEATPKPIAAAPATSRPPTAIDLIFSPAVSEAAPTSRSCAVASFAPRASTNAIKLLAVIIYALPLAYLVHMRLFGLCCQVLRLNGLASNILPKYGDLWEFPYFAAQSVSDAHELIPIWT